MDCFLWLLFLVRILKAFFIAVGSIIAVRKQHSSRRVISSRTHTASPSGLEPLVHWMPGVRCSGRTGWRRKCVHFRDKLLPTMWAFPCRASWRWSIGDIKSGGERNRPQRLPKEGKGGDGEGAENRADSQRGAVPSVRSRKHRWAEIHFPAL